MQNSTVRAAGIRFVILLAGAPALAEDTATPPAAEVPAAPPAADSAAPPQLAPFPKELLNNPEYIELGHEVFNKICKFCHGKAAYPGKAPKLQPSRYQPEFVYDRVTNGFRGMPSFKEQFSDKERQAVVVFIMSPGFSN